MRRRNTSPDLVCPLGGLDPDTRAFVDDLAATNAPPLSTLTPEQARAVQSALQGGDVAVRPAQIEDRTIPGGSTGSIGIRILRPVGGTALLPAVMCFHGGGWVMGDRETHDRFMREIAHGTGAAVIFVDYARSPEARYPVAVEQAYAATRWIAEHGLALGLDGARIAVLGDSAGGNMAAVVALLAKERGGPQIRLQVLLFPVTGAGFDTPSYSRFATDYYLTLDDMRWFWNQYLPDASLRAQPAAAPLHATIDQLRGVAPALIVTCECDVLRDEGEAYAHRLMVAGVPVMATRYLGAIHGFVVLNALSHTPAARTAMAQTCAALAEAFAPSRV